MPEMSDENYKLLLERLDKQDALIEAQNKKLQDIAAMNSALLSHDEPRQVQSSEERRKELEKKLKGGLFHA